MTTTSQHSLCRAGILIGAVLCLAALVNGARVAVDTKRQLDQIEPGAFENPEVAGSFVGEVLITAFVHLWFLPVGIAVLIFSLIWRRRLSSKIQAQFSA